MAKKYTYIIAAVLLMVILIAACTNTGSPTTDGGPSPATATEAAIAEATAVPEEPDPTALPTDEPAPTEDESDETAPTATATQPPTSTPAPTATKPAATLEPTLEPTPEPTATPAPTATPEPTAVAIVQPEWLAYLNQFRSMANLPQLQNDDLLTLGSQFHSQYMVKNDATIAHNQDESNPFFDPAGDQAAENGNIFATSQVDANYVWGVNFWISAPFHLVPMLDPTLGSVGFGSFKEAPGSVQMAAVLDVGSAPPVEPDVTYPIAYPADGSSTWVVRHSMFEWPDPLTSCPGFSRPTGAPIVLQLGDGSGQPRVVSHTLFSNGQQLETCLFYETTYRNPDTYAQGVGRTILDLRDAIVIMPRQQLPINQTYDVQVVTDSGTYDWSFNTIPKP